MTIRRRDIRSCLFPPMLLLPMNVSRASWKVMVFPGFRTPVIEEVDLYLLPTSIHWWQYHISIDHPIPRMMDQDLHKAIGCHYDLSILLPHKNPEVCFADQQHLVFRKRQKDFMYCHLLSMSIRLLARLRKHKT